MLSTQKILNSINIKDIFVMIRQIIRLLILKDNKN